MPREGGHVYAIVRAANNDAARARLRAGYDTGDHNLLNAFDSLGHHLTVVAGVDSSTWVVYISERLCKARLQCCHCYDRYVGNSDDIQNLHQAEPVYGLPVQDSRTLILLSNQ